MADNSLQGGADSIRDIDRSGSGPKTQVFQLDHGGAGATESLTSKTNPLPAYKPNRSATGNLTALNSAVSLVLDGDGDVSMDIAVTALVGTIIFEQRVPGGTFYPTNATVAGSSGPTSSYVNPASGLYRLTSGGSGEVRVRVSAFTSGSAVAIIASSNSSNGVYANQILPTKLFDGTNTATIKAASTAAVAADPSLVVALHPTSPLPAFAAIPAFKVDQTTPGTTNLVALAANQTINAAQINGVAPLMGTGISGTGALRVTLATDIALPTGANIIGALTANQTVNNAQIGGIAPLMGNGVTGTGSQRVTIASDNTPYAVKIDQTASGITNLVVASQIVGANVTTGDSGAKTVTGTGAIQGNTGNKGVQVVINMGAVTGTTPTFVGKLQGSADGGTTFYDIPGAATASLAATGVFGITVYPGIAVTAGTTTTGTTATANQPLPRAWRLVWTIGGTTPSFTITNVQFNYLVN